MKAEDPTDEPDVLSSDPATRAIEVAFLERISAHFAAESAPSESLESEVADSYRRFSHPIFVLLAKVLERKLPDDAGFGKFRSHLGTPDSK